MADAVPSVLALDLRFAHLAQLSERMASLDLSRLLVNLVDLAEPAALPLLAEQFHIMGWEGWDLATDDGARRELIKSAIELHRYKGTPWAVKQTLAKLGLERVTLIERPEGAHWAEFDLDITVFDRPVTPAIYPQITQLIDTCKPARSHLRRLIVAAANRGVFNVGCVAIAGDIVTVRPSSTSISTRAMSTASAHGADGQATPTPNPRTL
ncbi:MAG: phage tail protein [Duganella sp.]